MIDMKPLKDEAAKLQEPLRSIVEMSKNTMSESDFIDFFISMRKKAREIDSQNKEVTK